MDDAEENAYQGTGQLSGTKSVDQGQESLHGPCRLSKTNI
jgi:hypothetical protein